MLQVSTTIKSYVSGAIGSNDTLMDKVKKLTPDKKEEVACVLSYMHIVMNNPNHKFTFTRDGIQCCLNRIVLSESILGSEVDLIIDLCRDTDGYNEGTYNRRLQKFFIDTGIQLINRYAGLGKSQRLVRITTLLECKFVLKNLSPSKKEFRGKLAKIIIGCGHSKFERFDFSEIDFSDSDLSNLKFFLTKLSNSKFINSNLSGTKLQFVDLTYADLQNATLKHAIVYGSNLEGANLCGAKLDGLALDQNNINYVQINLNALVVASFPNLKRVNIQVKSESDVATLVYTGVDHSKTNRKIISNLKSHMDVAPISNIIVFIFDNLMSNVTENNSKKIGKRVEIFLNYLAFITAIENPRSVSDFIYDSSYFVLRVVMPHLAIYRCDYLVEKIVDLVVNAPDVLQEHLRNIKNDLIQNRKIFHVENFQIREDSTEYQSLQNKSLPILIRMLTYYPLSCSSTPPKILGVIKYPEIKHLKLLNSSNWWLFIIDRSIKIADVYRNYSPKTFENDNSGDGLNYIGSFLKGIDYAFNPMFEVSDFYCLKILHQIVKGEIPSGITGVLGVRNPCINTHYNFQKYIQLCGMHKVQTDVAAFNKFVFLLLESNVHAGFVSFYTSEIMVEKIYNDIYKIYSKTISDATVEDDKIRAIILFISRVEVSHFFTNCNNRICCQILLNRLLTFNGVAPCILAIPNGFSHQVIMEYSSNPGLSDSIAILREGQHFYARLASSSY